MKSILVDMIKSSLLDSNCHNSPDQFATPLLLQLQDAVDVTSIQWTLSGSGIRPMDVNDVLH
jgi:hypothetical protein